jgi:hypothetical protein
MSIVVDYAADPTLQATAAALGSGAAVANEQDWRERALAEQQYQFDQEYDWRVQQAALQDRLARSEMGNRTALGFGQLQSNNYNNQLDYMLGQQTLAQRDEQLGVEAALQSEQQQQLTNRAQMSQLGQIARQQQQQKFEAAMADRKAAEDWLRTASPRQAAQFRQRWEQTTALAGTAPDEAMAAEEEQFYMAEREKLKGMLQAPDGSGKLMVPEAIVDALMDLDKDKRIDAWSKIHDTWTRRKKDEQAAKVNEIKWEEAKANMQRDDDRAVQQLSNTQSAHQEKMRQAAELAKQKMTMAAVAKYQAARLEWAKAKSSAKDEDGKASFGPEPKLEDFMIPEAESLLEPGLGGDEIITNPAGKRAILHADGTVTPLN